MRVWVTQIMAMIGPPAVEALISVNKHPPGTGLKAVESWVFSLQALAGTADDRALSYIKDGDFNRSGTIAQPKGRTALRRRSEEAKAVETVLDIFKDPPRSIIKFVNLGGPMKSFQIIAIMASGHRREAQAIKPVQSAGGSGTHGVRDRVDRYRCDGCFG